MSGWPFDPNYTTPSTTPSTTSSRLQQLQEEHDAEVAQGRDARRAAANANLVTGALAFAIGLGITVATYADASSSPHGGTYIVAYGPMAFGLVRMARGLFSR
jgi:hypothetical protein